MTNEDKKRVKLSGIILAIWTGVFGFTGLLSYLGSDQVFLLAILAFIIGAILSILSINRAFTHGFIVEAN